MKKKLVIIMGVILIVSLLTLTACTTTKEITLPTISLANPIDESLPSLTGDNSMDLLSNIDRGFRLETYYTLGSGNAWPTDNTVSGYEMLEEELNFYKDDMVTEVQVYIYLSDYANKPLDDKALHQMKAYFLRIRDLKMSMLLRFSYDYEQTNFISPTQDLMIAHIAQLKDFMYQNLDLIYDTVTAYQFGCIGAWGEWGATGAKYNEKVILDALIDMMPEGIYFQGRYTRVTNLTKKNPRYNMVGYHNDFLIGRPHLWNTAGDKYSSKSYKEFIKNAKYRINDGEMPWGGFTGEPNEEINHINFIKQMMEHSMGTLSIKHNYKETNKIKDKTFNLEKWKNIPITAKELEEINCPYYDSYFKNINGEPIVRSVYDYLRDFLGYQLMLSNFKTVEKNGQTDIEFMLTNFGMGTPLTLDNIKFVVQNDTTTSDHIQGFDTSKLTTYGQLKLKLTIDGSLNNSKYGVMITRGNTNGGYHIKTANNLEFTNGINYIKN